MSIKVPLYFLTRESSSGIPSTRLFAWVSIKSLEKDLPMVRAIIDTGSPVSLIPFKLWGQAVVTMGEFARVSFFSDRPECELGITHGEITISLCDEHGKPLVKHLTLPIDLGETSEMPFILGMHGFLSLGSLFMNQATGEAWLEFPDSVLTEALSQKDE